MAEEITMFVAAIIIASVSVFGLVAAMQIPTKLIVDVETHGILVVENGVVTEDKCIGGILHLGL